MGKGRTVVRAQALRAGSQHWLRAGALVLGLTALVPAAQAEEAAPATDTGEKIIHSHGFSNFGDLKYPADFKHLDYVNPDAPKGGEISIFASGTFDSMNPYSREGRAGALSNIMTESLMADVADEVSAAYCLLCESIEYPESQDWVIFHMRKDAKFSDGTPVTAQDVVFSHFLLLDQGLPSYAQAVRALIPQAEALDDYTVKFTFAKGVPKKDLILQAGGVPVWSKAWYEKTGARLDKSSMQIGPGSGPYMLDSYDINRRIVYRRNPDYWGKDLPLMKGRSNFDTIRVEYFGDTSAAFEGFKAGEFTFRLENSSISWATGYDFPAVNNKWVRKAELPNGNLPMASGFVFNLRRPQFQDLRVRQAIALMYNFNWTNETLQYGLFSQRASFWQGSALEAKGVPEGQELADLESVKDKLSDPAILTEPPFMPHDSGKQQLDRKNLRQALALMEEAGWKPDASGRLMKDGKTLKLEFLIDDPVMDRFVIPYVENLKRLGVDASFNRVDPAQYTNRERAFDWDMIYDSIQTGLEEGTGLTQRFGTDGLGDVFNPAGYATPAVDALANIVIDAKTYDDMAAGVRAIDRIMRHDLFMVPTWYNPNYWVAYYDMFEHPDPLPPHALGYLDFWWFNKDKAAALKAAGAIR